MDPEPVQPDDDPIVTVLQERVARALAGFDALNAVKRTDDDDYHPPPLAALWASQHALVQLLVGCGALDHTAYARLALAEQAELLERALAEAVVLKHIRTGVKVPLGTMLDRPQG